MDALDHYSIPVSGLQDGLHEYDFSIEAAFFESFEDSPIQDGSVDVHLLFDKRPDMYAMTFEINGTVLTTCDRCLEEFGLPLEDTQSLLVKFDETEWEDADIVYVQKGIPGLNVARFIYEFIVLAVPMSKTHDDSGESCNPEMLKFLQKMEEEEEKPSSDSAWDALKGFNLEN